MRLGCCLIRGGLTGGLATLLCAAPARADLRGTDPGTAQGDGVYGRFDGDVDVGVGLGARVGAPGVGPNLRLSSHFLSTVGLVVDVTWPLAYASRWTLSPSIDLKPLFLPRWALNLQQGPAFWDLVLDSISVSGGPVFEPLDTGSVGFGFEVGFAIPLNTYARGFWIHVRGASRWVSDAPPLGGVVTLAWHTAWLSPATR